LLDETPDTWVPARGWSRPKYRNLRGARPILGYERVAGRREVFLVEGPFDYLTAVAWGLPACCTCGTNFRLDRLGFLASADRIFGIFDGDAAGRVGIRRFGPVLGDALRPLALPEGLDLNALALLPGGRARFEALLAEGRRGNFLRPPGDVCPVPA
jgi:DNA primase